MKKIIWFVAGIVLFFLISCSNSQGIIITSQEDTLRNELKIKAEQTNWTNEIEPERLSSKINNKAEAANREYITPQMLNSIKDLQPAVFPQIDDLASLDCSAMNSSLLSVMNNFCTELCNGTENLKSYFSDEYFFNYVFFKNDFAPIVDQLKNNDVLFERYSICKAFESQDLTQIPVRFYNKKDYVDLSVFLTYYNGYKITQIEVIRWGKLYGESEKKQ